MDLVEIRKKAKKLKESKDKEKTETEPAPLKSSKEAPLEEALLQAGEAGERPIEVDEGVETIPHVEVLPDSSVLLTEGAEETDLSLSSEQVGTEDFLSGVLDALYEEERHTEETAEDDVEEFLCFRLSDEEYAIDIHHVREIIKMLDITKVPKTPDFMLGIISLRGVIIPLLDLRMRLSLEVSEYTNKTRIIIASSGDTRMGMVVDAVTEVVRLKKGIMEAPPAMLSSIDVDLLKGVSRHEERLLIIPNLAKVFHIKI